VRARPDIQAAEALLHAANAEYGVAISKLYPQLNLSADLGSQALTTGALFGSGSAIWSLVGQLTQPLFNPGLPAEKRAALASFDAAAANYRNVVLESLRNVADVLRALDNDAQRLAVIPDMEAFYAAAAWAAAWEGDIPDVLDIGAGTGLLTEFVLKRYPMAAVTLIDLSEEMLRIAGERFAGREGLRFIAGDYMTTDPGGSFDIVVSALSIHHLLDEESARCIAGYLDSWRSGGIFVNADQVLGESEWIQHRFMEYWDSHMRNGPLTHSEIEEVRARRDTLDRNGHLADQLNWLRECGFIDVDVTYKNRTFVVFSGRRP